MAAGLLVDLFERGWSDPTKIHTQSADSAILINGAKENLAKSLKISTSEMEIVSDLNLGFHLAISGLLNSNSILIHSAIDRKDIFAIARSHQNDGGRIQILESDISGKIDYSIIEQTAENVVVWQSTNRETGIKQFSNETISKPNLSSAKIFADMTSASNPAELPENWSTALWDATSWGGPKGIAILAIREKTNWVNPLPHIDAARVSNEYSIPLFLASVVALENSEKESESNLVNAQRLNQKIRNFVTANIADADIAGNLKNCDPRKLSISFLYVQAEELLRELEKSGYLVDSGSACSAADLAPSHVLAAMGVLTHGNIRLTLRPEISEPVIDEFLALLKREITEARAK